MSEYHFTCDKVFICCEHNCFDKSEDIIEDAKECITKTIKEGQWENCHCIHENASSELFIVQAQCNVCKKWSSQSVANKPVITYEYCPRCGVHMKGVAND